MPTRRHPKGSPHGGRYAPSGRSDQVEPETALELSASDPDTSAAAPKRFQEQPPPDPTETTRSLISSLEFQLSTLKYSQTLPTTDDEHNPAVPVLFNIMERYCDLADQGRLKEAQVGLERIVTSNSGLYYHKSTHRDTEWHKLRARLKAVHPTIF